VDCCAQVSAPTLVKIISALSSAGRESTYLSLSASLLQCLKMKTLMLMLVSIHLDDCATMPLPSPLPSAVSLPITTALFGGNASTVAVSGVTANKSVDVELSLSGLQLGFVDADVRGAPPLALLLQDLLKQATHTYVMMMMASELNVTRSETNATEGTTTAYVAQLDGRTSLVQTYTFYREARAASFGGVNFTVAAGTIKWSFNLSIATNGQALSSAVAEAQQNGFTLRYRLSSLSSNASAGGKVERKRNTPQEGMTTFAVTLSDDAVAQVEVLNAAVIDDKVTMLGRIDLVRNDEDGGYALELVFPPFAKSVLYDPSLGFGVLLGREDGGDGSGSSSTGLVVGVAVAVPVALVVVTAVIVAGLVVAWRRRRNWAAAAAACDSVELGDLDGQDQENQL
jgi:hypothetical protein